jgi:hypothetical protein
MDVVSNVMAAWFHTGPETTLTLLDGLFSAPKSYREIFAKIDPSQVIVVTGEEDNVFQPKPAATPSSEPYPRTQLPPEPDDDPPATKEGEVDGAVVRGRAGGCASARTIAAVSGGHLGFVSGLLLTLLARRRRASPSR